MWRNYICIFLIFLSVSCGQGGWNILQLGEPCTLHRQVSPNSTSPSGSCNRLLVHVCLCPVAQLCLTLRDPMDYTLLGFSVHGISQARILEWFAPSSYRESSWPRVPTFVSCVSCVSGRFFYLWATREARCWCVGHTNLIFVFTVKYRRSC